MDERKKARIMYVSSKNSKTLIEWHNKYCRTCKCFIKDRVGIYTLSMWDNNINNRGKFSKK